MVWQDIVIMVVNLVLSLSLLPQLYHEFKEKKGTITAATSVPTFLGLYTLSFTYYTLSLYFGAITTALTGTLWLMFFMQSAIHKKSM